jgi:hypothetical protein
VAKEMVDCNIVNEIRQAIGLQSSDQ